MTPAAIERGMPDAVYQALPYLRASDMPAASKSMAHLRAYRDEPRSESDALLFGSLFHAIMDGTVAERFTAGDGPVNAKTGKPYGRDTNAYAAWMAEQTASVVPVEWWDRAHRMADSIRNCEEAEEFIANVEREVSFRATIEGVACKCRVDCFDATRALWADYKTTSANADDFPYESRRYQYPLKAAFQRAVIEAAMRGACRRYAWIVVEKQPPHECIVWEVSVEQLTALSDEVLRIVREVEKATRTGEWGGYRNKRRMLEIKPYMIPTNEEETGL